MRQYNLSEIKNFDTGIPIKSGAKIINLDPKENILNKKKLEIFLKKFLSPKIVI